MENSVICWKHYKHIRENQINPQRFKTQLVRSRMFNILQLLLSFDLDPSCQEADLTFSPNYLKQAAGPTVHTLFA